MIKKVLKINGASVLTKKQRAKIHGGSSGCPTTPGYTGQSCSKDEECSPIIPGAPFECFRGCCFGAF